MHRCTHMAELLIKSPCGRLFADVCCSERVLGATPRPHPSLEPSIRSEPLSRKTGGGFAEAPGSGQKAKEAASSSDGLFLLTGPWST